MFRKDYLKRQWWSNLIFVYMNNKCRINRILNLCKNEKGNRSETIVNTNLKNNKIPPHTIRWSSPEHWQSQSVDESVALQALSWLLVVAQSRNRQWRTESMCKVSHTLCSSHNSKTVLPAPTQIKWKFMSTQTCTQTTTTILFIIIKPWMHPRCPTVCGKSVVHPDNCLFLAHEKGERNLDAYCLVNKANLTQLNIWF